MSANGCEDLDCGPRDPDDPYSISCGQHYCNSAFTGQTCADDLGKNPACLSSCSTQEVNYDEGYWRTAPGMFNDPLARQDICRYRGLQNVLPTLQRFDNDLGQQTDLWTYLGTTHGVTDMWPGRPRERTAGGTVDEACVPFDPRIRPWYTTASSGPKIVALMLDRSTSMSEKNRFKLMQEAAVRTLDTLTASDLVGIYPVSDFNRFNQCNASVFDGTTGERINECELYPAKPSVVQALQEMILNLTLEGEVSDLNASFSKLFQSMATSLSEYNSSYEPCEPIVLLFADGQDCATWSREEADDYKQRRGEFCSVPPEDMGEGVRTILATIAESESDLREVMQRIGRPIPKSTIFTFSLGSEGEGTGDEILLRTIACANRGEWDRIKDYDDPYAQVARYSDYVVAKFRPASGSGLGPIKWTNVYEDDGGLGEMITAAASVWGSDGLIGVVGTDVTLKQLRDLSTDETDASDEDFINEVIRRSQTCVASSSITACARQELRGSRSSCASWNLMQTDIGSTTLRNFDDTYRPLANYGDETCLAVGPSATSQGTADVVYTLVYGWEGLGEETQVDEPTPADADASGNPCSLTAQERECGYPIDDPNYTQLDDCFADCERCLGDTDPQPIPFPSYCVCQEGYMRDVDFVNDSLGGVDGYIADNNQRVKADCVLAPPATMPPAVTPRVKAVDAAPIATAALAAQACAGLEGGGWTLADPLNDTDVFIISSLAAPDGSWVGVTQTWPAESDVFLPLRGPSDFKDEDGGWVAYPVGSRGALGRFPEEDPREYGLPIPRSVLCQKRNTTNASGSYWSDVCANTRFQDPGASDADVGSGALWSGLSSPDPAIPPYAKCEAASLKTKSTIDTVCPEFTEDIQEGTICEPLGFGLNESTKRRDIVLEPLGGFADLVCCAGCVPLPTWATAVVVVGCLLFVAIFSTLVFRAIRNAKARDAERKAARGLVGAQPEDADKMYRSSGTGHALVQPSHVSHASGNRAASSTLGGGGGGGGTLTSGLAGFSSSLAPASPPPSASGPPRAPTGGMGGAPLM